MPSLTTALVKSDAVLTATADANITDAETVVIAGKTYTFKTSLTDTDGFVKAVTAFAPNMANLVKAINLTGVAGTDYATSTTKNKDVLAVLTSSGVVTITARVGGTVGNFIPITVGTSAVVLSGETSGKLNGGLGDIAEAINDLQSRGQLNSDIIEFLALLEIGPQVS